MENASKLIAELLSDPSEFNESGRAYKLLQCYVAGFPVESLHPLLLNDNAWIQRSATFIVSELGIAAASLVEDLPPLLESPDLHVVWYAMEAITVCSVGEHLDKFAHVVLMLESEDDPIRQLAMRLLSRAGLAQVAEARRWLETSEPPHSSRIANLAVLLSAPNPNFVLEMIGASDPLTRRYGAIAAKRLMGYPTFTAALNSSEDPDLQSLAEGPLVRVV